MVFDGGKGGGLQADAMSIANMTRAGLSSLRTLLESPTFTWKSLPVPCVPNTLGVGSIVADGGYDMTVSLTLFVDREEFLTVDSTLITMDSELYTMDNDRPTPVTGKTIVYQGSTRRIVKTAFSPDNVYIILMCADANA
jgi:hypothetical protein